MVRKAVRTLSQVLAGFERADEEDARIRSFYEPSGPAATRRSCADPESSQQKCPASATRKHRYAHLLDWSDDITTIYNVDRNDGAVRVGASPTATAFAADRRGRATRALAAALNCAVETASRLNLTSAPTTSHTSRLAERLLRATQAPLPPAAPPTSATPTGSANTPPRPESPGRDEGPLEAWEAPSSDSPSWPSSPLTASHSPAAAYVYEQQQWQQQQQQSSGPLLNSSARLLYYGSAKPRLRSAPPQGRGRPVSAPGQPQPQQQQRQQKQQPTGWGPPRQEGRTGADSSAGASAVSSGGAGATASVVRPASARPASGSGGTRRSPSRPASAFVGTSPYAASVTTAAGSAAFTTRRRSTASCSSVNGLPSPSVASANSTRPPPSPRRSAGSSVIGGPVYGTVPVTAGTVVAPSPAAVSPAAARHLAINPCHLQQAQPKNGPCNGVVVRDPVGPQLVTGRRTYGVRPYSAPPGGPSADGAGDAAAGLGAASGAASTAALQRGVALARQQQQQQQRQQQSRSGSVSPHRQRPSSSPRHRASQGGASSPTAVRQYGTGTGGSLRKDESMRSTISGGPNAGVSTASIGSVAVAAAAAAAAAFVNAGVTMTRRRHSALAGARKALWSQIADAAGVMPYDFMDDMMDDGLVGGTAAVVAGPSSSAGSVRTTSASGSTSTSGVSGGGSSGTQLAVYLAQQASAGLASDGSGRTHSRTSSPDPWARVACGGGRRVSVNDSEGFDPEVSAAHYLMLSSANSTAAAAADGEGSASADTEAGAEASEGLTAAAQLLLPVGGDHHEDDGVGAGAAERETAVKAEEAAGESGQAASATPSRLRLPSQENVMRLSSLLKRTGVNAGGEDEEEVSPGAVTPTPTAAAAGAISSKRVQWGANVLASPRSSSLRLQVGHAGDAIEDGTTTGHSPGGRGDLGRPPRYPLPLTAGAAAGARGSPAGSPQQALLHQQLNPGAGGGGGGPISPPSSPVRRRGPGRADLYDADDDEYDDLDAAGVDDEDSLPSLEVSTAAGVLDRARPAAAGAGEQLPSSGEAASQSHLGPDFYHLTARVDRVADVQGWLFNVYLTDIMPDNPIARRCCVASCTTADEHRCLLVPQPAATASTTTTTTDGAPMPQVQPLTLPRSGPLISPAHLLPWVSRPEQLLGHWLRLEAFAVAPVADKVVDAVVYMGQEEDATPPQPKLSRLQVLDVRAAQGGSKAGGLAAGSGVGMARQQHQHQLGMNSAGNAALIQVARLATSGVAGGLLAPARPASARRSPSPYKR